MRYIAPALLIAVLAALPALLGNYYLHLATTIMIFAIVALGLDIVFGYTGEVSIGHAALFGIGAYTAGGLLIHAGLGLAWAMLGGIAIAAGFGLLLAMPALQVTGPYLAMVTLAFGTIVQILINEIVPLTRGPLGISLQRPVLFDWRPYADALPWLRMSIARLREVQFYVLTAAVFLLCLLVVQRVLSSRFGRAFEALRDAPIAADCMGVSVYRYKVIAFVVSAGFAGLAGAMYAYSEQYIAPNTFSFDLSIQFLLAVTVGGRKSRVGPILGAIIIVLLPSLLADIDIFRAIAGGVAGVAVVGGIVALAGGASAVRTLAPVGLCMAFFAVSLLLSSVTDYKLTVFGAMILFVVYYLPDGIWGFVRSTLARARRQAPTPVVAGDWSAPPPRIGAGPLLAVRQALMQFGGLRALDQVDLVVAPGTIHGLIGPNGSGKSTMMNVLTGIYAPTSGDVQLEGQSVVGRSPAQISLAGIARTFQNVQLFRELTCLENVMVGLNRSYRAGLLDIMAGTPRARREEAAARRRALGLLRFIGLDGLAAEEARQLPYGKQRLLEIARALALDPKLLLLDEPAAGLTAPDIAELLTIIRRIRDQGITLILIEHHMDVVMSLCDTVTVLDFGQKIAEGRPAQVQADQRVIAAYLGGAPAVAA